MAKHNSIVIGDTVTHPEWPDGETRTVVKVCPFMRLNLVKSAKGRLRTVMVPSTTDRIITLDKAVDEDGIPAKQWMELGLEIKR